MASVFQAISISYKNAPLQIREQIALNEFECKALLLKINELLGINESLILSTCNRTEVYYFAEDNHCQAIVKTIAILKGVSSNEILPYFDIITEQKLATKHLFEVAAGLHSQVVGDMQIPNQVKQAYQLAADAQMAGPFLHRLMHTVFYTNKRVAQETSFRDGAASVSYAAVELIESFMSTLPNPKILVVGLGEIGEDVCRNLVAKAIPNLSLTNRTKDKAARLAIALSNESNTIQVLDFEDISLHIKNADIIISSLRKENFINKAILDENSGFKYFIDLSVPRSISAEIEQINGVVLYNIDEIQNRANEALSLRMAAIPAVEQLIDEALMEFDDWSKEMVVSPMIQKMKNALEQIRKEELGRFIKNMSEEEADRMEKVTTNIMQKIIKLHVVPLKAACKRGEADTLVEAISELFDLEKKSNKV